MATMSELIVNALLADVTNRAGIGDEYDAYACDIKDEIRIEWIRLVQRQLDNG